MKFETALLRISNEALIVSIGAKSNRLFFTLEDLLLHKGYGWFYLFVHIF